MKTLFVVVMTDNMDKSQPGYMGDGGLEVTPPTIKLCCTHDPLQDRLWYYEEADVGKFVDVIGKANKIYTVQGGVDVASLVHRYGMPPEVMCEDRHFDLLNVIANTMGRRLSYRGIGELHWNAVRWLYRCKVRPLNVNWQRVCQVEAAFVWELWNVWNCGCYEDVLRKIELALGFEPGYRPTFCPKCGAWGEFEGREPGDGGVSCSGGREKGTSSCQPIKCVNCEHMIDFCHPDANSLTKQE